MRATTERSQQEKWRRPFGGSLLHQLLSFFSRDDESIHLADHEGITEALFRDDRFASSALLRSLNWP